MTVKELIDALKDYDEWSVVKLVCSMDDRKSSCNGELVFTRSDKDIVFLFADC